MGKLRQLSPELWPLIDVILFSYIELIFSWRGIMLSCSAFIFLCVCFFIHSVFQLQNIFNVFYTVFYLKDVCKLRAQIRLHDAFIYNPTKI